MSRKVGVWIDHREAIIVAHGAEEASVETVRSDLEKRVRTSGGSRSRTIYGPQDVVSETGRDRRYGKHLSEYYDRVLARVGEASSILVFGPGEAKGEFLKKIEASSRHRETATEIQAADKLTRNQIVAKVKEHFA